MTRGLLSFLVLLSLGPFMLGCSGGDEAADGAGGPQDVEEFFAHLSPEDKALAKAQAICPVSDQPLGSMGNVLKVVLDDDRVVFICCEGCESLLRENPDQYLAAPSPADPAATDSIPEQ